MKTGNISRRFARRSCSAAATGPLSWADSAADPLPAELLSPLC
jgi:hypothetical protein